jgi:hypothetical protein
MMGGLFKTATPTEQRTNLGELICFARRYGNAASVGERDQRAHDTIYLDCHNRISTFCAVIGRVGLVKAWARETRERDSEKRGSEIVGARNEEPGPVMAKV